jgi:DNA (cytosine-5)-methyltransferase 3A
MAGFPCTKFSIAQKNRETDLSGEGGELFMNCVYAIQKFQPDLILLENNHSIAQVVKDRVSELLGIPYVMVDSALVSAQQRRRIYWLGKRNATGGYDAIAVPQPEDIGILLKDILERGEPYQDKSYCLTAIYNGATLWNSLERGQRTMVAEPVCVASRGRYNEDGSTVQHYEPREDGKTNTLTTVSKDNLVAEPVIFNNPHGFNVGGVCYDKAPTLTAHGSYAENHKVLEPIADREKARDAIGCRGAPIRVGNFPTEDGELHCGQAQRIYGIDGKSVTLKANGGGGGAKTGLYAIVADGKTKPIYEVSNGQIEIKGKLYPIKLPDGCYIIRKLTPIECERLQTLPDNFTFGVSNSQRYKMLGNAWTCAVIEHLLSHGLRDVPKDEHIVVLSMYDGISCGQLALQNIGYNNLTVYAMETDKYAIQTTQRNFPETIQLGDAFVVRENDWRY